MDEFRQMIDEIADLEIDGAGAGLVAGHDMAGGEIGDDPTDPLGGGGAPEKHQGNQKGGLELHG